MKMTMRQLRRLIREELDLGDVVFSPSRKDGAPTDEPNTPAEEKLFAAFSDWVQHTDWARLSPFLKELEAILKSPGAKYSDFFREPPRGTPLYCGMQAVRWTTVEEQWLTGPKNAAARDAMDNSSRGEAECDFTLDIGDNYVSSWTTKFKVAEMFAMGQERMFSGDNIILVTYPEANPEPMLDLAFIQRAVPELLFAGSGDEGEVLGFGPTRIKEIRWGFGQE